MAAMHGVDLAVLGCFLFEGICTGEATGGGSTEPATGMVLARNAGDTQMVGVTRPQGISTGAGIQAQQPSFTWQEAGQEGRDVETMCPGPGWVQSQAI